MPLTRRFFLEIFGVGTAAVAAATNMSLPVPPPAPPIVQLEPQAVEGWVEEEAVPLRPSRPTRLETFLRSRGIKPAHLALESGYGRKHLLHVRTGRLEATPHCAVSIVLAARRLSREPIGVSDLFDPPVVRAARGARKRLLRKFHPFERQYVRRCFA